MIHRLGSNIPRPCIIKLEPGLKKPNFLAHWELSRKI